MRVLHGVVQNMYCECQNGYTTLASLKGFKFVNREQN